MAEQPQYVALDNQYRFLAIVFSEVDGAFERLAEIVALPPVERDAEAAEWARTLHLDAWWVVPKALQMRALQMMEAVLVGPWLTERFEFQHEGWWSEIVPFETWGRVVDKAYAKAKRAYAASVKIKRQKDQYLHWLFEFQVLRHEYAKIADDAAVKKQYVQKIVPQTAKEIGLTIRPANVGRPQKTTTK